MRITLAQLNYQIGNFEENQQKMLDAINKALEQKSDLIIFSELAVCGYPPRDFLEFNDFIEQCMAVVNTLALASTNIGILVGAPTRNPNIEGKDLYNSAYYLYEGKIQKILHKALLPTYDVFDEYRYFEPAKDFDIIHHKGYKIAITICEDMWNVGNNNPMYTICPTDEVMVQHPQLLINLSASPFHYKHAAERIEVAKANVARYKIPLFYCNQTGAQTELIFDGGSLVLNALGAVYDEMPFFVECVRTYQLTDILAGLYTEHALGEEYKEPAAMIYEALLCGIKDYFNKSGLSKATLGLSGGIDSVLTTVLATHALGADNVHPILMPSQYSSEHSISDSELLCHNLGLQYSIIPIKEIYDKYITTLLPTFGEKAEDLTEENLQARIRANILMAYCNKMRYILLNTTNKSEAAVGYGTLYGDMCGGLGILGDVYKTQIYDIARYINRTNEIIPINCIHKAPSAELRPGQKDSDSLPEYSVLDKVLYQYIEMRQGPKEIIAMGFDDKLVHRVLKMVNSAEHKRHQTPPILRVSPKAFGSGRRMPIVAKYLMT